MYSYSLFFVGNKSKSAVRKSQLIAIYPLVLRDFFVLCPCRVRSFSIGHPWHLRELIRWQKFQWGADGDTDREVMENQRLQHTFKRLLATWTIFGKESRRLDLILEGALKPAADLQEH